MRPRIASFAIWVALSTDGICQQLPGTPADLKFDTFTKTLELDDPALVFTYKSGKHEGSSVGFHVSYPGQSRKWTYAPDNTSNNPEAEVVSYRLARVLGFSSLYNPVTLYRLGPQATARFKKMLRGHGERSDDKARLENRSKTLANLESKTPAPGTFRIRIAPHKRAFLSSLTAGRDYFNRGSRMGSFIQAGGALPSDTPITFSEVKRLAFKGPPLVEIESEIARQLSDIFLIDQLTGQWDRFANNLEATIGADGHLRLIARDNGGATVNDMALGDWTSSFNPYNSWLSRYDRAAIERLEDLNEFLQGRAGSFDDFTSVEAWKTAMGFQKQNSFTTFKRKVALLVEKKIPELERQHGLRAYFTLPPPESPAAPEPQVSAAQQVSAAGQPIDAPPAQIGSGRPATETVVLSAMSTQDLANVAGPGATATVPRKAKIDAAKVDTSAVDTIKVKTAKVDTGPRPKTQTATKQSVAAVLDWSSTVIRDR